MSSFHLSFGFFKIFNHTSTSKFPIISGEEYFGNMDSAMENMEVCETESIDPSDDACILEYGDEDSLVAVEGECSEDDDSDEDYYNSILKPAFLVEGKPDFDSGPPQDGLEYLRRVRYCPSILIYSSNDVFPFFGNLVAMLFHIFTSLFFSGPKCI